MKTILKTCSKTVIFLDDNQDLRQLLIELIEVLGHQCLAFATYNELVASSHAVLEASLAILDINLGPGQLSGYEAYEWLKESKFRGKVVFLTGHARSHPLVARAHRVGEVEVLQKPIDLLIVRKLLTNLNCTASTDPQGAPIRHNDKPKQ